MLRYYRAQDKTLVAFALIALHAPPKTALTAVLQILQENIRPDRATRDVAATEGVLRRARGLQGVILQIGGNSAVSHSPAIRASRHHYIIRCLFAQMFFCIGCASFFRVLPARDDVVCQTVFQISKSGFPSAVRPDRRTSHDSDNSRISKVDANLMGIGAKRIYSPQTRLAGHQECACRPLDPP
jgi:hypothetical protein